MPDYEHTPGPWHYSSGAVWADKEERVGIAQRISTSPILAVIRDRNICLCAAAPTLLTAVEDALHILSSDAGEGIPFRQTLIKEFQEAIREAKGE